MCVLCGVGVCVGCVYVCVGYLYYVWCVDCGVCVMCGVCMDCVMGVYVGSVVCGGCLV